MPHLQVCPEKNIQCNICKKIGHYASLCTAKMPERRIPRRQQLTTTGQSASTQARPVPQVKPEVQIEDSTEESADAEAALYIKELKEDWANISLIHQQISILKQTIKKKKYGRRFLGGNVNRPRNVTMVSW